MSTRVHLQYAHTSEYNNTIYTISLHARECMHLNMYSHIYACLFSTCMDLTMTQHNEYCTMYVCT